ncbi:MAG: transglycosylase domain-containing protein [Bacteroidetes bacterium]|nr:transglycosylase domain-containing protein [Bacteroidota bacterium]
MSPSSHRSSHVPFIAGFWILFTIFLLLAAGFIWLVSLEYFGPLPDFKELENPRSQLASEIYSSDHRIIGKYYYQNRTNTDFSELSPRLVHALLATEDIRFAGHSGVDFKGLTRVFFRGEAPLPSNWQKIFSPGKNFLPLFKSLLQKYGNGLRP